MTAAGRAVASAGYAPANGLQVYYEIHGAGEPLVLLHGAMGTIQSCFGGLLPALARSRQVIALELQGHGHTADTDRPLSYEQLADDVVAVVGGLGVDRADFVGYSMGGAVAIQTAMRHPGIVRRVVYAGGASYTASGLHPAALQAITATTPDDLDGSVWQQAYLTVAPRPSAWATLVAKVNALDRSFTGWTVEAVRAIAAPTLLIIGDADIVRPEHTVEMFRLLGGGAVGDLAAMPASQLAVLPGTSHVGVLDRVEWLRSMILEFLGPARRASDQRRVAAQSGMEADSEARPETAGAGR